MPQPEAAAKMASAQAFQIIFDGGAIGNPGRGYGSFRIRANGDVVCHEQVRYEGLVTNNQAEYRTLILALEFLRRHLGTGLANVEVDIRGDSQLVINQVNGAWKVKNADLRPLHQRVGELLRGFGRVNVRWHDRRESVRVLGH